MFFEGFQIRCWLDNTLNWWLLSSESLALNGRAAGISLDLIQFKPVFPIVTEKIIKHLGVKWVNSEFSFSAQCFPIRNRTFFSSFQKKRGKTRVASIILNKRSICWKLWWISIAIFYCSHDLNFSLKPILIKLIRVIR